ncbi:hypothetical protein Scep_001930 [Stephania cephalantha]|uniref:Protein kinase domain-containing protein n=1 Tax=Stephania cephalantha TaxID=152367 RepID=A0AAP0LCZ9_9MAGN
MRSHLSLILISADFLYLIVLVFCSAHVFAKDHMHHPHRAQYNSTTDRDTLHALKGNFNGSFIDTNWSGSNCCLNDSSTWFGIQCLNNRVIGISLEGVGLSGEVDAHAFANLTELSSLSFKNNWISGTLMNFSSNTMLVRVDLSSNMFEGAISNSLLSLQMMESLQLQDNNLIGPIPGFSQKSLREFNVSNNNLLGKIPETDVLQSFRDLSYSGNPGLCGSPTLIACNGAMTMSEADDESESNMSSGIFKGGTMLVILIVLDVIAVVTLALFFTLCYKKVENIKQQRKKPVNIEVVNKNFEVDQDRDSKSTTAIGGENGNKRRLVFLDRGNEFELDDLLKASAEMLGKGNFGNVYKVILDHGQEVVVKRLRDLRPLSREEFVKRIRALADLKHQNLLSPLAYYYSREEKLLVYKFAAKGNLFNLIHGERGENRIPFKWSSRLRVAIAVARGMEFLHANTKLDNAIPHGNLKSSNVLLDENQKVLVSDHALASLITLPISVQQMSAYKCPEYQHCRKVSRKTDVWCYGSLLLELLTGRVPSFAAPKGTNGVDLSSWAHRAVREEWTAEIFDPEISRYCTRRHEAQGMMKLLELALWCCDKSPEKRPDMHQVAREIGDMKVNELEDEEDLTSFDRSLTEDSISTNGSGIIVE